MTLAGYEKHLEAEAAPPPLTNDEIEKAEIRAREVCPKYTPLENACLLSHPLTLSFLCIFNALRFVHVDGTP